MNQRRPRMVLEGRRPGLDRRIKEAVNRGLAYPPDPRRDQPPTLFEGGVYRVELRPTPQYAARQQALAYGRAMADRRRQDNRRRLAIFGAAAGAVIAISLLGFIMSATGWGMGTITNIAKAILAMGLLCLVGAVLRTLLLGAGDAS